MYTGSEAVAIMEKSMMLLKNLPDGVWFDFDRGGLEFIADTQEQAKTVRGYFPGVVWKKHWAESTGWWSYTGEIDGVRIRIFGVTEAPKTCTPIIEKQKKVKQVPTGFREEEIEEEVIVGWNCSDGDAVYERR